MVSSHPICPTATHPSEMSITAGRKTPTHSSEAQQPLMHCLILCRAQGRGVRSVFHLWSGQHHRDAGETFWVTQPGEEGEGGK